MFVVFLDRPLTNTPLEPLGTIAPLMAFFLWKKKRGDGKKEEDDDNNTTKRAGEERKQKPKPAWNKRVFGHDGWSFLSLSLLVSVSLSLGLIRLLVEMKAMGEDSGASDESVCAVIALIKRAV